MHKITVIKSIPTPLNRANIDTDIIIPKQFLKSIKRTGFGINLFDSWRYLDDGYIGIDNAKRKINKDFVLNNPKYINSKILLTGANFGCGSSREHAPWALFDYGFRVIIATSFADIFYNNCFKNGILLITQTSIIMNELFASNELSINLLEQSIKSPDKCWDFSIDKELKLRLINGLDDIDLTLQYKNQIKVFEKKYFNKYSYLQ